MAFSGIIELLGVKELAEYDSTVFTEQIKDFKYKLTDTAQLYQPKETGNIIIYNFRDYCYLQSESLKNLIDFIKFLQISVIRLTEFPIRAALTAGELGFEPIPELGLNKDLKQFVSAESQSNANSDNTIYIRNIEYSNTPARLYGIIERLKGIGIFLDQDAIELKQSANFFSSIQKEFCFDNFYISEAHKFRYEHFVDCKIDPTEYQLNFKLASLVTKIPRAAGRQPKFGRYYIPLLMNLIKNYNLQKITQIDLTDFFEPLLKNIKGITGHELVYGTIVNKFFEPPYLNDFKLDSQVNKLIDKMQKTIANNRILVAITNEDYKNVQIPREILPYSRKKTIKQRLFELAPK